MTSASAMKPGSISFFSIFEQKTFHLSIPQGVGCSIIGSSNGFLVTVDDSTDRLHAYNPFTGAYIARPPTKTHCGVEILQFRKFCDFWPDDPYYTKGIVCPWSGAVAVMFDSSARSAAFAFPGDSSWTALEHPAGYTLYCFFDILFHKRKLYAVNERGVLIAFDLLNHPSDLPVVLTRSAGLRLHNIKGLLESPDGNHLFLLTSLYNYPRDDILYKAFRLNESKREWEEVEDLDDLLPLVGVDNCVSFPVRQLSHLERNLLCCGGGGGHNSSIVYVSNGHMQFGTKFSGVFDLKKKRIKPSCLWPKMDRQPLNWFTPSLF